MLKWFVPILFLLLIAGCTTLNVNEQAAGINKIIDLINNGEGNTLVASSRIPFIYDGEIILLKNDLSMLWDGLCKSGLAIKDPQVKTVSYIDDKTYALFTTAMEGKVFFKRHLPDKTLLTTVSTKEGIYYFLTGSKKSGLITIFGMKGPVQ